MHDRGAGVSQITSPPLRLFVARSPALQHQTRQSLAGVWLCDSHRESLDATTTPEIDGQLKSARRRLEACDLRELLKHAKMSLVYIRHERETRESEREGENSSSLSISDLSQSDQRREKEETAAQQIAAETNAYTKKVLIFYVALVS